MLTDELYSQLLKAHGPLHFKARIRGRKIISHKVLAPANSLGIQPGWRDLPPRSINAIHSHR